MGYEPYIYALFIFGLLCVLVVLYRRAGSTGRRAQAEQDTERAKQERLFKLYQNIEDMMDSFEGYLEQSREQMQSERARMDEQLAAVEALCQRAEAVRERLERAEREEQAERAQNAVAEAGRSGRHDIVRTMLDQGMTPEEIARAMDVSINEIKLIVYGLTKKTS